MWFKGKEGRRWAPAFAGARGCAGKGVVVEAMGVSIGGGRLASRPYRMRVMGRWLSGGEGVQPDAPTEEGRRWIPASAGMTGVVQGGRGRRGGGGCEG